jgi:RHH-type proline utilization regulon transcriptional repressor/proline dehydrogenase/delta 1-pyrroline-5-carboxylate dehydrogenase
VGFADPPRPLRALRDAIDSATRRDERECVRALLPLAHAAQPRQGAIRDLARRLVSEVRAERARAGGVDALMHEFSLDSSEGVALMCLAEALIRIPDPETADRLIRDKIARGDWKAHLGRSASLFVNAAAWGLMVSGELVATHSEKGLSGAVSRLIARGGEPLIRKAMDLAMRLLGRQFVAGETIAEALERSREREARGYRFSYDMLGEAAMTEEDARRYLQAYEAAIHALAGARGAADLDRAPGISVKLSALHPRYGRAQRERVLGELLPRLAHLACLARRYDLGISIDAEEAARLDLSLDLLEALAREDALAGWNGIGFVVQAYQKRCPFVIDWLVELARATGRRFRVRLVKGAYWDAEVKRAQIDGLDDYPVYTRKAHTDLAYIACAQKLLAAPEAVQPQFATHNAHTLATIFHLAGDAEYEFQCLHGMGESLYDRVVGPGGLARACRIYAPVGTYETLLPYLVRRLLENGANTSFVNRLVDERIPIEALLVEPAQEAERSGGAPHPRIPLPPDLYGEARRNSVGLDLSDERSIASLEAALAEGASQPRQAGTGGAAALAVRNPANHADIVGTVGEADAGEVSHAVGVAVACAGEWASVPANERAACLERAAGLLQARMYELAALAVREAGKSAPAAVAEVREAIDFCRYYAAQARAIGGEARPRGPIACISPWNFPLAIFMGQVSAALAAGSPVLAKPAEQTPLTAAQAVRLLHEAGVPAEVVQLVPGRGEVAGAALVHDPRIGGVLFTGSGEVARAIDAALAARDDEPLLVAETGGQNAMIADSSALPEQLVADALVSAFDSAGQRCSALRVLYLQADIAERTIALLKGAMLELRVGDPAKLATDVGPVIDLEAQARLAAHIERMRATARWIHQAPLAAECAQGTFVAPTTCEISSIAELEGEVFGPILHVVRFAAQDLDRVIAEINATGYGLTCGVQSRVDETIERVVSGVRAGNLYVNRNMIGAVVGVQPFGGEGRSGTGPKAGGPLYLPRLMRCVRSPGEPSRAAALPGLDRLAEAALAGLTDPERIELRRLIAEYRVTSPLRRECAFAGPTGQRDTLHFVPRGTLACVADRPFGLARQAAAALAGGNRLVLPDSPFSRELAAALGDLVEISLSPLPQNVALVLFEGDVSLERPLRTAFAASSGAIVPLVRPDAAGRYELYRLVAERSVSVNTAAAGGNAALLSLSG